MAESAKKEYKKPRIRDDVRIQYTECDGWFQFFINSALIILHHAANNRFIGTPSTWTDSRKVVDPPKEAPQPVAQPDSPNQQVQTPTRVSFGGGSAESRQSVAPVQHELPRVAKPQPSFRREAPGQVKSLPVVPFTPKKKDPVKPFKPSRPDRTLPIATPAKPSQPSGPGPTPENPKPDSIPLAKNDKSGSSQNNEGGAPTSDVSSWKASLPMVLGGITALGAVGFSLYKYNQIQEAKKGQNQSSSSSSSQKDAEEKSSGYTVESLFIYPVKGCAALKQESCMTTSKGFKNDRIYCIIEVESNRVVTQRDYPRLLLCQPRLDIKSSNVPVADLSGDEMDEMTMDHDYGDAPPNPLDEMKGNDDDEDSEANDYDVTPIEGLYLTPMEGVSEMEQISVPVNETENERLINYWDDKDKIKAYDQGDDVADWLNQFLEIKEESKRVRLVKIDKKFKRMTPAKFTPDGIKRSRMNYTRMHEEFPILVATQESLDVLNMNLTEDYPSGIPNIDIPLTIDAFRPNIVLASTGFGDNPEKADLDCNGRYLTQWGSFTIGDSARFQLVKPFSRSMIPGRALSPGKRRPVLFGQYAIGLSRDDTINVDDAVSGRDRAK